MGGAAAALAATRKKRSGPPGPPAGAPARQGPTPVSETDPVLSKRVKLQHSQENLLTLISRVRDTGATAAPSALPRVKHAITMLQPFASGVLAGKKTVENRSWSPKLPTDGAGVWLAVHAGRGPVATAKAFGSLIEGLERAWPAMPPPKELPRGAILGLMHVRDVVPVDTLTADPQVDGPLCWLIDRVLPFEQPVHGIKGWMGLWRLPDDMMRRRYVRDGRIVCSASSEQDAARAWPVIYKAGGGGGSDQGRLT